MKKTLLTLALAGATVAAFAQGKVTMQNDGSRLVTLGDLAGVMAQDSALANQAVPVTGPLPSGVSLVFGLYAGTSSTSLSLVSTTGVNPAGGSGSSVPGQIVAKQVILPFAGGSVDFFQVRVWDSTFATYEAQLVAPGAHYLGNSPMFTMTPGTSIAYPAINLGGGTTWGAGPIIVSVPEPSTFALAGLGAAALMIFRRRK